MSDPNHVASPAFLKMRLWISKFLQMCTYE